MKWLISTIVGVLVLAVGISFSRAHMAAALAEKERILALVAAQTAAHAKTDDAFAGPDTTATEAEQPAASNDAAPSALEKANKPAVRAGGALVPRNSNGRVVFEEVTPALPAGDLLTPASSDRKSNKGPTANPAAPAAPAGNGPSKTLIVPVQHRAAASLADLLKRMLPKGGEFIVDPDTNALIFPEGVDPKFLTLVQELDQPVSPKTFDRATGADNAAEKRQAQGRRAAIDWQSPLAETTSPSEAEEYQQYESQARELAKAYRQQQATSPADAKQLERLKGELQGAVHAAFYARQTWQRAQAAQLRTRLEQIERRISDRGQSAGEIIQRRVEELLHPERQWESNNDGESTSDSAVKNTKDRAAAGQGSDRLAGTRGQVQKQADDDRRIASKPAAQAGSDVSFEAEPVRRVGRGSLSDSAGDVRKDLLNAESAVASAQAAIAEAKAAYERSKLELMRAESAEKGVISEKVVRAIQSEVERNKSAVDRAESELGIKQRMLASARETLAVEIKLREADVADAKRQMDHATAELARFEALYKQNAISLEDFEGKKLPQELAASQYERAKLLLELYRKTSIVDKMRADQKPTSDWKTDFAAAQGLALKQHRPLIAIFCRLADQTTHEFRAQVLEAPEVNRIVVERFKLVFVDLDAPENSDKLIQFGVDANPTILILREDGSILTRSEGGLSKIQFLDVLNKINRAGRAEAGANDGAKVEPPRRAGLELTLGAPDDPRERLLDAAHAVTSARAAVVEAEAHVAEPLQTLKLLQSANAKASGSVPQKAILDAEQAFARGQASVQKMRVELEIKERQLDEARESLASQIKLQELDLADAKLRLQYADDQLARADNLYKKGAMADGQHQEAQLAQQLAKSQYLRALLQVELYHKALPDKPAAVKPGRQAEEKPGTPQSGSSEQRSQEQPSETMPE